jgi:putative superfamily III holin-X
MDAARTSAVRRANPETTIPELVRWLGDDSKHLVSDEVRLAKLEMREAAHHASAGALSLAIAFAAVLVAVVAATVFVATLIGRVAGGHMWLGSIVAAVLDLVVGALLVKKGLGDFAEPAHAFEELKSAQ